MKMAMKKGRVIASSLAVALMLSGAGYAAWTDQLTINNTVSTGEFKVEFVDDQHYPKIFGRTNEAYITKSIEQINSKTTTITVGNFYPGGYVRYEAKIKNNGTIPVVFDNAQVAITETQAGFTNALQTQVFVKKYHADGTAYVQGEPGYWAGKSLGYKPAANLEANLNNIMAGLRLEPNEFVTFDVPDEYLAEYLAQNPDANGEQCVEIKLPDTVGTVENPNQFEKANATLNITINWKQHNQ
jgi:predicted ribosomally synthesized peptide with SipW-like signal peptide